MYKAIAVVNGRSCALSEASLPVTDLAFTVGWSVFETMVINPKNPDLPRLAQHHKRLLMSCAHALIEPISEALFRKEVLLATTQVGCTCRVRITLTASDNRVVVASPATADRAFRAVTANTAPHLANTLLPGSVKHSSRAPWVVGVKRAKVDELLLIDSQNRFTEGTTSAIAVVTEDGIFTAPSDGEILASTSIEALIVVAHKLGMKVTRERYQVHAPRRGLYITSSSRILAPVVSLNGAPQVGWEPVGLAIQKELKQSALF